jgi:hypothetical protein
VNIKNGLQVLVLATIIILTLIISMTALAVIGSTIPTAFPEALALLVAGLVGAAAVHISAAVTTSKDGPSGPSAPV